MEWKDYEYEGVTMLAEMRLGQLRICLWWVNNRWKMGKSLLDNPVWMVATDLAQAKQEAAAIVRVALEEALAALVGGDN